MRCGAGQFVLKIHNGVDSEDEPFIQAQNDMMKTMRAVGIGCNAPMPTTDGREVKRGAGRQQRWQQSGNTTAATFLSKSRS